MGEKVLVAAKKPDVKRENLTSHTRKPDQSKSMSSPIERVLFLQRTIGNQAVQRLIKSGTLLAKLKIGQPGDVYEQEADRVADAVMRMPEPQVQRQSSECEELQRQPVEEKEKDRIQPKPIAEQITRLVQKQVEPEEEEELIQAKIAVDVTPEVTPSIISGIQSLQGGGQPLSGSERSFFKPRFGADFSNARVHNDTRAANVARSINARAFTFGHNVVFGAGEYSSDTSSGRKLLAHELTHVVQQGGGLHRDMMLRKLANVYEQEADEVAHNVIQQEQYNIPKPSTVKQLRVQREVAAGTPVNDRTTLGQADIEELFELYASESDEFTIPSVGARFTRDWVRSSGGTALIRGHIRAQLAEHLHEPVEPFAGMREWFSESIDRTTGDADRLSDLHDLVNEAFDRIDEVGLEGARRTSPVLMDVGKQGSTFSVRETRASIRARRLDPSLTPVRIMHAGLDAPSPLGTGIYVPLAGRVIFAGRIRGYGNIVRVLHETPPATTAAGSGPVITSYAHMNEILVSVSDELQPGQAVGTVGATTRGPGGSRGRVSSGMPVHLHFSVQRVISERIPLDLSGDCERNPLVRVRPDSWLSELEVNLSMGVPVEDRDPRRRREAARSRAPAESAPTESAPTESAPVEGEGTVQRKALFTTPRSTLGIIQRIPFDDSDPVARLQGGMTLPYREATELLECIDIMGQSGRNYCYQQVLGIPAPAIRPGATLLPPTTGAAPTPAAVPSTPATGLNVSAPGVVQFTTPSGNFYRFPAGTHHINRTNRPQVQNPASAMVVYSGAGSNGTATVHPAVVSALDALMSAMHAEGLRINDESLKQARVQNAFRGPTVAEGNRYLSALRTTISSNVSIFGALTFPASLETMARSELGFSGSPAHRAFEAAVAAQPGWSTALARELIRITARYKAPRGGSTHHSGVVADIDFPYATSSTSVHWHGIRSARNADAFRSAAGVWLNTYAQTFNFDTYDSNREIFHQEWLNWAGTSADPSASSTASP